MQSQRDIARHIPINFVTYPGISLSAACFSHKRYDDGDAVSCMSNLLSAGFQRLVIDLYWDEGRQLWSFCPVSILTFGVSASPTPGSSAPNSTLASRSSSSTAVAAGSSLLSAGLSPASSIKGRAELTPSVSLLSSRNLLSSGSLNTPPSLSPTASISPSPNTPLLDLGPYFCTSSINVSTVTSLLLSYIQETENTLDAHLLYLIINIHAAASASSASLPAQKPKTLPQPANLLSTIFQNDLSPYMYTPTLLRTERQDLNQSWYGSDPPDHHYFTVRILPGDIHSTIDGWPNEAHVEFTHGRRLLVGWGSADPQMSQYNFTGDNGTIFQKDELEAETAVSATSSGVITDGCFFSPSSTKVDETNSSWALGAVLEGPNSATEALDSALNLTTNLASCGISPFLNTTLLNVTASQGPTQYLSLSYHSTWSWEANQPQNTSRYAPPTASSIPSSPLLRCAAANPRSSGRWRADDCSRRYSAACRVASLPYGWRIAPYATTYGFASEACPSGTTFSAPRTGLENLYLHHKMLERSDDDRNTPVWIDFNSMNTEGCWVTGGPNATCPYFDNTDEGRRRTVIVPIIAAIIILFIAGLTIFVKCGANRRVSRRRKRVEGGWEYEGVPS
ncbi:MAG: hypothetical protein M1840_003782 [Geoglossum simile]|nr:MAG: hypothetical protein M1840_003782 [Geoglossum simile]